MTETGKLIFNNIHIMDRTSIVDIRIQEHRYLAHNECLRVTAFPGRRAHQTPRSHIDTSHGRRRTCRRGTLSQNGVMETCGFRTVRRGIPTAHCEHAKTHDSHYCHACMSSYTYMYLIMNIYIYIFKCIVYVYIHLSEL